MALRQHFAGHCGGLTAQVSLARVDFCVYFGRVSFAADSCVRTTSLHFCFRCQKCASHRCEGSDWPRCVASRHTSLCRSYLSLFLFFYMMCWSGYLLFFLSAGLRYVIVVSETTTVESI